MKNPRGHNPAAPGWLEVPLDHTRLDAALWPMGTTRDSSGEITISGHRVSDLISEFGSPLYVMDEDDFRARARRFVTEFPTWEIHYASKAFLCRAVARWVGEEGLSLDVCSGNELALALSAGFPAERIGMHGNNKSVEELAAAIDAGVGSIIVDSFDEIDRIETLAADRDCVVRVLVRITTGVAAHTHEYIATSHEDQKFGFSLHSGQAMKALLACVEAPHIHLGGIHSHIGSQILDIEGFRVAARRMMGLVSDFRRLTRLKIEEVNLGGGFGIAYTGVDIAQTPAEINRRLTQIIDQAKDKLMIPDLRMSIEPGRAICGTAGVALYRVGTIKRVDIGEGLQRTYVSVDGGMSDNIRTALYHADYTAVVANRASEASSMLARVVGKHCESGDILVRDVYLPDDLRIGDVVAIPGSGAYARSLASNYNYATKPAVIAVTREHVYPIIRRERFEDLMALDVDPGQVSYDGLQQGKESRRGDGSPLL